MKQLLETWNRGRCLKFKILNENFELFFLKTNLMEQGGDKKWILLNSQIKTKVQVIIH